MDTCRAASRNGKRQRLVTSHLARVGACLFLAALCLTGLPAQASPKPPNPVLVELSQGPIVSGSRFDLTIKIPDTGISSPEAKFPSLPSQITLLGGPEILRDNGLDDSGHRTHYVGLRYQFRANSPGYLEFPAVDIQFGSQQFQSNPFLLGIAGEGDPKHVPPSLSWNVRAKRVSEGQAVYLSLELRFAETINFPDKVELGTFQGGSLQEVSGLGRIEMENVLGREFPRIPVASYILTPSAHSSTLNLPMARVNYGAKVYSCPAQKIAVEALPPELAASAAIGELRFSAFLDKNQVGVDEQFLLTLRVEGEGNLNYLRMPEPVLGDLKLLGKADNSRYLPSESGFRGFREIVYRLSAAQSAQSSITVGSFAWMDSQAKINISPALSLSYAVGNQSASPKGTEGDRTIRPFSVDETRAVQPHYFYNSMLGWLFYLPGILLMCLALAMAKAKRRLWLLVALSALGLSLAAAYLPISPSTPPDTGWQQAVKDGTVNFESGDYQAAYQNYTAALNRFGESPAIMYNLSIACFGKNANAQGMYFMQKALRALPDKPRFQSSLRWYEKKLNLDRQLPIVGIPAADILFLVGAVALAMAGLFLILSRRFRLFGSIACSLFFLAAAVDLGLFGFSLGQIQAPVAIISETGGTIRKIPDARAVEWLTLRGGTSVLLLANSGNFWLVETAYGVKGWLDISAIYTKSNLALTGGPRPKP